MYRSTDGCLLALEVNEDIISQALDKGSNPTACNLTMFFYQNHVFPVLLRKYDQPVKNMDIFFKFKFFVFV